MLHLDVKGANVLLRFDGPGVVFAKLADVGVNASCWLGLALLGHTLSSHFFSTAGRYPHVRWYGLSVFTPAPHLYSCLTLLTPNFCLPMHSLA